MSHTEESICPNCSGSGEGMYEGTRCSRCHGSGSVLIEVKDQPEEEEDAE
jgi:DnaJ-class molecular chaperone